MEVFTIPRGISTRKRIFDTAIDLFSEKNYKLCTIRELAELVDIKSASLYKHYKSKDDILLEIFEYYKTNFNKNRKSVDDIVKAADTQPLDQAISVLFYLFGTEDEQALMLKITRIIMDLKYENEDAQKLFIKTVFDDPKEYLHAVFDALIAAGKIKPFDYEALTMQMIAFTHTMLVLTSLGKDNHNEMQKQFQEGVSFFARMAHNAGLFVP